MLPIRLNGRLDHPSKFTLYLIPIRHDYCGLILINFITLWYYETGHGYDF